ncbi:hypothetical protein N7414_24885 [Pseudomonas sp. GD04087]|nr:MULTISPECIES: hypothetical protein [Pseudomonas]MDH0292369.1 hypothetical protein [Pseudomonas sp. GD04087]MDH1048837.1 hypothetical protein [Pseudomonas sp. GD03903]MDH2001295.1 hypothetical protein [Pseudomonas sp. GD03691]
MISPRILALIACLAVVMPASAQKFGAQETPSQAAPRYSNPSQWQQSPPAVQRIYVSPGASGSVDSSSSWQRYDGYGGVQVPRSYGETRSGTVIIDQGSGGIRQSIEYPNGAVYPRGNGYYQQQ